MINVICVKAGDKFNAGHVNRLYKMVSKHLTIPFTFYCLTDNPIGIHQDIRLKRIKHDWLELWWNKLPMFEDGFMEGRCLYFDLDVIIQHNIDDLVWYQPEGLCKIFAYWKDKELVGKNYDMRRNSSCLTWNAGEMSIIWEYFLDHEDKILLHYHGIDRYMYWEPLPIDIHTFPKEWFYSRFAGDGEQELEGLYYRPERKVCLLNGQDYCGYTEEEMLKGLEHYYNNIE